MIDSLDAFRALAPERYLDLDGLRYHYVDVGTGPAVVLLHGNPSWSFYYRNLIERLAQTHRVIAPDHIGCGWSDKPQSYPYRLQSHLANFTRLVDHLKLERFGLVVHDWGGPIGLGYAVQHAAAIERMLVLNTTCRAAAKYPFRIRVCHLPGVGSALVRGCNYFALGAAYMGVTKPLRPTIRRALVSPYDSYKNRIATLRFIEDIPRSIDHPSWQVAHEIEQQLPALSKVPVSLCWGMRDPCFTPRFLEEWTESFPQAQVQQFANAGHYVLEDETEAICAHATEFFA